MTAPVVDVKIHWLKMISVPEGRAVVGRHDGINGRDNLEKENGRLRKAISDLTLDKLILKEALEGNC